MAAQQQNLFNPENINLRQFEPVKPVLEGAAQYSGGKHSVKGLENVQADRPRAYRVQHAYQEAERSPEAPGIRRSYKAMGKEVGRQYRFMTAPKSKGGMGIHHEVVEHDPYSTPQEMAEDVRQGHIKTMSTETTGGHAFFSNEKNDQFRAVHDVFGHAAIGRGFDRHGEEAAYLSHRQMFPRAAQAAMASETRGQNAYLNYGPHPGTFPEQSEQLIGLPSIATGVSRKVRKRLG
jgi:hypothetical protein